MLVNSFTNVIALNLGTFTVNLPNRTENGVKLTAKKQTLVYTGLFVKSAKDKMFI
jgi:hypothetical protein